MIVLDTNVVSELARPAPAPEVVSWLDGRSAGGLAITAITAAELLYGVARLPAGRRRAELTDVVLEVLNVDFVGRILPFDAEAAEQYGALAAERERRGRTIPVADAQIAAICAARGLPLATRNSGDFTDTGIDLLDPWVDS